MNPRNPNDNGGGSRATASPPAASIMEERQDNNETDRLAALTLALTKQSDKIPRAYNHSDADLIGGNGDAAFIGGSGGITGAKSGGRGSPPKLGVNSAMIGGNGSGSGDGRTNSVRAQEQQQKEKERTSSPMMEALSSVASTELSATVHTHTAIDSLSSASSSPALFTPSLAECFKDGVDKEGAESHSPPPSSRFGFVGVNEADPSLATTKDTRTRLHPQQQQPSKAQNSRAADYMGGSDMRSGAGGVGSGGGYAARQPSLPQARGGEYGTDTVTAQGSRRGPTRMSLPLAAAAAAAAAAAHTPSSRSSGLLQTSTHAAMQPVQGLSSYSKLVHNTPPIDTGRGSTHSSSHGRTWEGEGGRGGGDQDSDEAHHGPDGGNANAADVTSSSSASASSTPMSLMTAPLLPSPSFAMLPAPALHGATALSPSPLVFDQPVVTTAAQRLGRKRGGSQGGEDEVVAETGYSPPASRQRRRSPVGGFGRNNTTAKRSSNVNNSITGGFKGFQAMYENIPTPAFVRTDDLSESAKMAGSPSFLNSPPPPGGVNVGAMTNVSGSGGSDFSCVSGLTGTSPFFDKANGLGDDMECDEVSDYEAVHRNQGGQHTQHQHERHHRRHNQHRNQGQQHSGSDNDGSEEEEMPGRPSDEAGSEPATAGGPGAARTRRRGAAERERDRAGSSSSAGSSYMGGSSGNSASTGASNASTFNSNDSGGSGAQAFAAALIAADASPTLGDAQFDILSPVLPLWADVLREQEQATLEAQKGKRAGDRAQGSGRGTAGRGGGGARGGGAATGHRRGEDGSGSSLNSGDFAAMVATAALMLSSSSISTPSPSSSATASPPLSGGVASVSRRQNGAARAGGATVSKRGRPPSFTTTSTSVTRGSSRRQSAGAGARERADTGASGGSVGESSNASSQRTDSSLRLSPSWCNHLLEDGDEDHAAVMAAAELEGMKSSSHLGSLKFVGSSGHRTRGAARSGGAGSGGSGVSEATNSTSNSNSSHGSWSWAHKALNSQSPSSSSSSSPMPQASPSMVTPEAAARAAAQVREAAAAVRASGAGDERAGGAPSLQAYHARHPYTSSRSAAASSSSSIPLPRPPRMDGRTDGDDDDEGQVSNGRATSRRRGYAHRDEDQEYVLDDDDDEYMDGDDDYMDGDDDYDYGRKRSSSKGRRVNGGRKTVRTAQAANARYQLSGSSSSSGGTSTARASSAGGSLGALGSVVVLQAQLDATREAQGRGGDGDGDNAERLQRELQRQIQLQREAETGRRGSNSSVESGLEGDRRGSIDSTVSTASTVAAATSKASVHRLPTVADKKKRKKKDGAVSKRASSTSEVKETDDAYESDEEGDCELDDALWMLVERSEVCTAERCTYREPTSCMSKRRHYHALCDHIHQEGPKQGMSFHHHQLEKIQKHQRFHTRMQQKICPVINEKISKEFAASGVDEYDKSLWSDEATVRLAEAFKLQSKELGAGCKPAFWSEMATKYFPNIPPVQLLLHYRYTVNGNATIKGTGTWTDVEDARLGAVVAMWGQKWAKISEHMPGRIPKQCRERFLNHIDPSLKRLEWTKEEDRTLVHWHNILNNKFAGIARCLPGRSYNEVKNRWNQLLKAGTMEVIPPEETASKPLSSEEAATAAAAVKVAAAVAAEAATSVTAAVGAGSSSGSSGASSGGGGVDDGVGIPVGGGVDVGVGAGGDGDVSGGVAAGDVSGDDAGRARGGGGGGGGAVGGGAVATAELCPPRVVKVKVRDDVGDEGDWSDNRNGETDSVAAMDADSTTCESGGQAGQQSAQGGSSDMVVDGDEGGTGGTQGTQQQSALVHGEPSDRVTQVSAQQSVPLHTYMPPMPGSKEAVVSEGGGAASAQSLSSGSVGRAAGGLVVMDHLPGPFVQAQPPQLQLPDASSSASEGMGAGSSGSAHTHPSALVPPQVQGPGMPTWVAQPVHQHQGPAPALRPIGQTLQGRQQPPHDRQQQQQQPLHQLPHRSPVMTIIKPIVATPVLVGPQFHYAPQHLHGPMGTVGVDQSGTGGTQLQGLQPQLQQQQEPYQQQYQQQQQPQYQQQGQPQVTLPAAIVNEAGEQGERQAPQVASMPPSTPSAPTG